MLPVLYNKVGLQLGPTFIQRDVSNWCSSVSHPPATGGGRGLPEVGGGQGAPLLSYPRQQGPNQERGHLDSRPQEHLKEYTAPPHTQERGTHVFTHSPLFLFFFSFFFLFIYLFFFILFTAGLYINNVSSYLDYWLCMINIWRNHLRKIGHSTYLF